MSGVEPTGSAGALGGTDPADRAAWTHERPAPGVVIAQPKRRYRYAAESFWLAGEAMAHRPRTAIDLGTGSGVIAMLLAGQGVAVTGVDVRPEWQEAWAQTLAMSEPRGLVRMLVSDIHELKTRLTGDAFAPGGFDVVVSNPPFFRAAAGKVAADDVRRTARTESTATVADFARIGGELVGPGGALVLVVPTDRSDDVEAAIPPRLAHRRALQVGAVRTMWIAREGAASLTRASISDDGPEVRAWYHAVGARFRDEAPL